MIEPHILPEKTAFVACCNAKETQHATNRQNHATDSATMTATSRLKALAGKVLERKTQRKGYATDPEKPRNKHPQKNGHLLREITGNIVANNTQKSALALADNDAFFADDRRHCHECQHLNYQGRCKASPIRYSPVDDIPRRCADFSA